jgi:hypothetical protein
MRRAQHTLPILIEYDSLLAYRYCRCGHIITGSKLGWMIPLLGDAFFTSAMRAGNPVSAARILKASTKSLAGGAVERTFIIDDKGIFSFI